MWLEGMGDRTANLILMETYRADHLWWSIIIVSLIGFAITLSWVYEGADGKSGEEQRREGPAGIRITGGRHLSTSIPCCLWGVRATPICWMTLPCRILSQITGQYKFFLPWVTLLRILDSATRKVTKSPTMCEHKSLHKHLEESR